MLPELFNSVPDPWGPKGTAAPKVRGMRRKPEAAQHSKSSAGVRYPSRFRGRAFRRAAIVEHCR
jgi:hypothetical protein